MEVNAPQYLKENMADKGYKVLLLVTRTDGTPMTDEDQAKANQVVAINDKVNKGLMGVIERLFLFILGKFM